MRWGACKVCGKGMKCKCRGRPTGSTPASGAVRVAAHNTNKKWCSACGCLVRNGSCVSATCGKEQ